MQGVVGKHTYGKLVIHNPKLVGKVIIGNFCSIAPNAQVICSGYEHNPHWATTYPFRAKGWKTDGITFPEDKPNLTIGHDVWIGRETIIKAGITIGSGAIIGAGARACKNVPPYAIIVGDNKILRYRFSEDIIEGLLKLEWWNWDDKKIEENLHLILSDNVEELLNVK